MRLEYLRHQEIDYVTVRAAESAHESVAVSSVLQRERGEVEPGRPSLRLPDQGFDIFGREAEPEAAVQEGVRLLAGEAQIAGRISSSSSWARSAATGRTGSVLLASTSWNPGGAWSMNHRTLARAGTLESR